MNSARISTTAAEPQSTTSQKVIVNRDVLADKRQQAAAFRDRLTAQGTLVINLVSSPGAGKTSLLEATAQHWKNDVRMAVLVGDLATERDADRLRPFVPVQQLTTGGACHLELGLVERGLAKLPEHNFDFLFIENVGNLVCPASHDLGEHLRIALLSTTEGDDKPGKYPKMFRTSHALVMTKTDLLPYVPFNVDAAIADAKQVQPDLECFTVSSLDGSGIAKWCEYLQAARRRVLSGV